MPKNGNGEDSEKRVVGRIVYPENNEMNSIESIASGHRKREMEWRQAHESALQAFAGQWVILEGEKIITHGKDPVRLVAKARKKGIKIPYIFYVETIGNDVAKMGL